MKILQLGKFYPIRGGVEKVMYDLVLGLSKRGVRCDMMCAESHGRGTVRHLHAKAAIYSFRTWNKVASTTIAPSMVSRLRTIAAGYDIIHVHHPDPMAAFALRMSGFKGRVVLSWHSDILKNKALLKFFEPLQTWLLNRADVIIGTSPAYIEHSPALSGYRDKARCIPIGTAGLQPDLAGATAVSDRYGRRKIIFSLGRLVPYKGYEHLVRAAALLPDDYVVLIGGEGPLRDSLLSLRDSLGLQQKVHFLGRIPDSEISAYYTASRIFCLPSVWKTEAFGIVQIEAMSLGKPIVATNIKGSGVAWVNSHGVSGLNVEPGSPADLAAAIRRVVDDPSAYAGLSEGARARYESQFTLDSMIDRFYQLYSDLIS